MVICGTLFFVPNVVAVAVARHIVTIVVPDSRHLHLPLTVRLEHSTSGALSNNSRIALLITGQLENCEEEENTRSGSS